MSKKPVFDLWDPTAAPENWARFSVKAKDGVIAGISAEDGVGAVVLQLVGDELQVMFRQYLLSHHETMTVAKAVDGQTIKLNMTKNMVTSVFVDGIPVFVGRLNQPSYRGLKFQFFVDQKVTDLELYNGELRDHERRALSEIQAAVEKAGQDYWLGMISSDVAEKLVLEAGREAMAYFPDSRELTDLQVKVSEVLTLVRHAAQTEAQ